MKKLIGLLIFLGCLNGCGQSLSIHPLTAKQPQVVSISPSDGSTLNALKEIEATLSQAVDPSTVDRSSFLVFKEDETDLSFVDFVDTDEISNAIESEKLKSLSGVYRISEDSTQITWVSNEPLEEPAVYRIILTSAIQTIDHYPLNQTPGDDASYFISQFTLTLDSGSVEDSESDDNLSGSENESEESGLIITSLVINEIYYDDETSDTDGNLFIELYGTPGGNISGYSVRFINGANGEKTDEVVFGGEVFIPDDGFFVLADSKTGSSSETNVAEADAVENFDPQNGPDSVQLFNPSGGLIDVVGYGEELPLLDAEGFFLYEGTPASSVETGLSLARLKGQDTDNNSTDFIPNLNPSPGTGEVASDNSQAMAEGENSSSDETSADQADDEYSDTTSNESEQNQSDSAETETEEEGVHFTEVVTDPQHDWGDSTGGDGVSFDSLFGSGTVGSTDEWIEIKNGGDDPVNLSGWRLEMVDGTDEVELFSAPSSTLVFFSGGGVQSFQPDEFLVLGNPPGDLKNTLTLELYDDDDSLVDALSVDNANATGADDESYQLMDNQVWEMGEATIGF